MRKEITCRFCGKTNLRWKAEGAYKAKLVDVSGVVHDCRPDRVRQQGRKAMPQQNVAQQNIASDLLLELHSFLCDYGYMMEDDTFKALGALVDKYRSKVSNS